MQIVRALDLMNEVIVCEVGQCDFLRREESVRDTTNNQ